MNALVLKACRQLVLEHVPDPTPGPRDVVVAVRACGICGSDVHGMDGSTGRRRPPIIMGHEASGEIVAVGTDAREWGIGDRVTFDSTVSCGECAYCKSGQINLCDRRRVLGVSCEDYRQHGAMCEYVSVPKHILYRVPDELPAEHAALVEPVSVAVHAVRRLSTSPPQTAVVIGAGVIGLLILQALRNAGCRHVFVVDIDSSRLELAGRLGASQALNPSQIDVIDHIRVLTNGSGAQAVFEAVGLHETFTMAVSSASKGGSVVLVGNVASHVNLALQTVVTRELHLVGSCASAGEYPLSMELMKRGNIQVGLLISATAPLTEGPHWFDRLYNREPGLLKVVLKPGQDA
ncbi:MAG: alcohol dehydrogenase [Candidatus Hydrogenedentota bacterium]